MGGAPRGSVSDLLLGHGEDELALGAVRHGGLDDVADAGRGQREVARVDERLGPKVGTKNKRMVLRSKRARAAWERETRRRISGSISLRNHANQIKGFLLIELASVMTH